MNSKLRDREDKFGGLYLAVNSIVEHLPVSQVVQVSCYLLR